MGANIGAASPSAAADWSPRGSNERARDLLVAAVERLQPRYSGGRSGDGVDELVELTALGHDGGAAGLLGSALMS